VEVPIRVKTAVKQIMKTFSELDSLLIVRASLLLRHVSCPVNLWTLLLLPAGFASLQFNFSQTTVG
jgi:hypothetical protein